MKFLTVIALVVVASSIAAGQTYTEMGMMSGSGLAVTPTNIVSPPSEFRINLGRFGRANDAGLGYNLMTVSMGFSPILEAYARFTSEQAGNAQSFGAIGFGGKILVPVQLPVVRVVSIWGETSMSEMTDQGVLVSPRTSRFALLNTPVWSDLLRPTIILGAMKYDGEKAQLMAGGNLVISPTHTLQFGMEYIHSYSRAGSQHASVTGAYRVLPNLCIQAGPGYVSNGIYSGMMWAFGISLGTAAADFRPAPVVKKEDYVLPSIEDLLKPPAPAQEKPSDKPDQKEDHQ
jgi:hypothetical protein